MDIDNATLLAKLFLKVKDEPIEIDNGLFYQGAKYIQPYARMLIINNRHIDSNDYETIAEIIEAKLGDTPLYTSDKIILDKNKNAEYVEHGQRVKLKDKTVFRLRFLQD